MTYNSSYGSHDGGHDSGGCHYDDPANEDEGTCLLEEDFSDGWNLEKSENVIESDFVGYYGSAATNGTYDGELVFKAVDTSDYENVKLTLDVKLASGSFESSGWAGDSFRIEIVTENGVIVLDEFRGDGQRLYGSETGQVIDPGYDKLSYVLPEGIDSTQIRIVSNISADNEVLKVDNVKLCGDEVTEPDPGWIRGRLTFDDDNDHTEFNTVQNDNGSAYDVGLAGELVQLVDLNGNVVAETTTGPDGWYQFDVAPGDYRVKFPDFEDFIYADKDVGVSHADSDANPDGFTDVITVVSGYRVDNVDASVQRPAQDPGWIKGRLTFDDDRDHTEFNTEQNDNGDAFDVGLAGQLVQLVDLDGNVVLETTTDAYGAYQFDVAPGQYRVKFPDFDDLIYADKDVGVEHADSDANPDGFTDVITVESGQVLYDIDASVKQPEPNPGWIKGRLSFDDDCDHTEVNTVFNDNGDTYDTGIAGELVQLVDLDGNVVLETYTNADGWYQFDVAPGQYRVQFPQIEGTVFADQNVGDEGTDSDADANGLTEIITVESGQVISEIDASVKVPEDPPSDDMVCIEFDMLDDGTHLVAGSTGENGALVFDGVTFTAIRAQDTDGVFNDAMIFDAANPTGGDNDLFQPAQGNVLIISEDGDSSDPDDNAQGGQIVAELDHPSTVNEVTLLDVEEPGATIELLDADGNVITTIQTPTTPDGGIQQVDLGDTPNVKTVIINFPGSGAVDNFKFVPPVLGTIAGTYFLDTDGDDLDNGEAEPGIEGARVFLLDSDGNVIAETATDANGDYSFIDLPAGDYKVAFENAPDGTEFVAQGTIVDGVSTDTEASDADPAQATMEINGVTVVMTEFFTLDAGEDETNVDIGVVEQASLGDFVFFDDDGDGVQDAGEAGVAGVTVTLTGAGEDGVLGTADDTVETTVTDENGLYGFDGLSAGETYQVAFDASTLPENHVFTQADQGGDDALDSDADANGLTPTVTLAPGEHNGTIDAGIVRLNEDPTANSDSAALCADTDGTDQVIIDVLGNDSDPDGDTLTITDIIDAGADGILGTADDVTTSVSEGQTVTLTSGAEVTLSGGQIIYSLEGTGAFSDVLINDTAADIFGYVVSDGNGATAVTNVDIEVKGALNTLDTIEESLPETFGFVITDEFADDPTSSEAFTLTISSDDERFDGLVIEEAYCLAFFQNLVPGTFLQGDVFLALEDAIPADALNQTGAADLMGGQTTARENLDLVNWILNQDFGSMDNGDGTGETYTDAEIQNAIWALTDETIFFGSPDIGTFDNALEIVEAAFNAEDAEGFVPGEGDLVGLFIDPTEESIALTGHAQPFIIGVRFEDLAEECDCPEDETGPVGPQAFSDFITTTDEEDVTGVNIVTASGSDLQPALGQDNDPDGTVEDLRVTEVNGITVASGSPAVFQVSNDQGQSGTVSVDEFGNLTFTDAQGFDGVEDETALFQFDYTIVDPDGLTDSATVRIQVTDTEDQAQPRLITVSGTVQSPAPAVQSQGIVILMDVTSNLSNLQGNANDLNGDFFINAADRLIERILDLADDLVASGRGDQAINIVPVLSNGTKAPITATAAELAAIDFVQLAEDRAAGNDNPLFDDPLVQQIESIRPEPQEVSIDFEKGLEAAKALLTDESGALLTDTAEIVVLTASNGQTFNFADYDPDTGTFTTSDDTVAAGEIDQLLAHDPETGLPIIDDALGIPATVNDLLFSDDELTSDPTALATELAALGVDIDLISINPDDFVVPELLDLVTDPSGKDAILGFGELGLSDLIAEPTVIGELDAVDGFTIAINGETVDGIDASSLLLDPETSSFSFEGDLSVQDGDEVTLTFVTDGVDLDGDGDFTSEIVTIVDADTDQINFNLDLGQEDSLIL